MLRENSPRHSHSPHNKLINLFMKKYDDNVNRRSYFVDLNISSDLSTKDVLYSLRRVEFVCHRAFLCIVAMVR